MPFASSETPGSPDLPAARQSSDGFRTILYAATIFLGAFLLFLVEPLLAKLILPWFGGSAAVWATCLVFFQVALLLGYHLRGRYKPLSKAAAADALSIWLAVAEPALAPATRQVSRGSRMAAKIPTGAYLAC